MKVAPVLVLLCVLAPAPAPYAQAPDLENMDLVLRSIPDGPVVKVNGVNIKKEEYVGLYQNELATAMLRSGTSRIPDRLRLETGVKTLVRLVQRELLYQEAQRRKLSVKDEEVEERWASELEGLKKQAGRAKEIEPSEDDILKIAGATRERALEELRKALVIDKMKDTIAKEKGVRVTDREMAEFFEEKKDAFKRADQLHVKHIFINTRLSGDKTPISPEEKKEARERIENALERVQAGESFEAVAKNVSDAPDKDKGGDLGLMPTAQLPPFYIETAGSMNPGDLSGVIESELGYHIIKLADVIPGEAPSLEKAKPIIRRMLLSEKTSKAIDEFCKPFMEKPGYVEVYLQFEKTLAAYPGFEGMTLKGSGAQ